ncbi:MAG: ankyrin repeat domain-containing protein [Pseudomonadales bacterium]|nr:ankyrin repeat domain-containing protein [Pseudomonadales bacterium]
MNLNKLFESIKEASMDKKLVPGFSLAIILLCSNSSIASNIADAAMNGDAANIRELIALGVDIDEPQSTGATALHWVVQRNELTLVQQLLRAGANPSIANRLGIPPLQLAAVNGNADIISELIEAGANPNTPVTPSGDTALMLAARTGIPAAVKVLLDSGADVNARESWGLTSPLMWAINENHVTVAKMLIDHGAELDSVSVFIPPDTGRGFEGAGPRERLETETGDVIYASGELTPLLIAAREGHMESVRLLLDAGADINAVAADGKNALALAIFNGHYAIGSYLIDRGIDPTKVDAQNFTPLFWAVDRRNMETAPNFPWMVTDDPLSLIRQMLDAGVDPNYLVDNTPRARMRGGSPRIVFATALMRAAFSADLELFNLLLKYGADPHIMSKDGETSLSAAAATGWIAGFHIARSSKDRLQIIKKLVELGSDVNWHDNYGITPLMTAANFGDVEIIQYLIDAGADLGAYDLGKKNDGAFGASIEPLMPVDYAIGVGTFRPNNAIVFNEEATELMFMEMKKRGIEHTTSECTLRGFTCAAVNMDPRAATPADIARARRLQTGYQVEEITTFSGLSVTEDTKTSE